MFFKIYLNYSWSYHFWIFGWSLVHYMFCTELWQEAPWLDTSYSRIVNVRPNRGTLCTVYHQYTSSKHHHIGEAKSTACSSCLHLTKFAVVSVTESTRLQGSFFPQAITLFHSSSTIHLIPFFIFYLIINIFILTDPVRIGYVSLYWRMNLCTWSKAHLNLLYWLKMEGVN